ncbi:MAG: M36 family metallopeptidase [Ferruginibacter sp.]
MESINAKIELHPYYGTPGRMYDFKWLNDDDNQESNALPVLRKIAHLLKIKPDLSQLKFDQQKESLSGSHFLYQQQISGKPVSGAWIRLDTDKDGRVYNIMNELLPEGISGDNKIQDLPKINADDCKSILYKYLETPEKTLIEYVQIELVYFVAEMQPVLAWKCLIRRITPFGEWKVYVNATNGQILQSTDLLNYVSGAGRVFDPNPFRRTEDFSLRSNSIVPENSYTNVVLNDLEETGMLDGPFVSTKDTKDRVMNSRFQFHFSREGNEKSSFKEVMVYYHIDAVQRYIQQLGFNNIMNKQVIINVNGGDQDNSFYSPISKGIKYGNGGVEDAEDGEIIVHEYGHAIIDFMVPGFGNANSHAKAMNEGFADYLAASFFANKKPPELIAKFGSWNAVAMNSERDPPFMRQLDGDKTFSDFANESHGDGEIWSACLWGIREKLGQTMADILIFEHLHLLSRNSTFASAAKALLQADQQLNQGANAEAIKDVFIRRKVLLADI